MMSKFGFVAAHVYCNYLMGISYLKTFDGRQMVQGVSGAESLRILMLLVVVCNVVGMCLMMKRHRTWFVVALHTLMPYGICTMLSYVREGTPVIVGGLIVAGLLSVTYAVLIFRQKIKNRTRYKTIMFRRIGKSFAGVHCCVGTALALFAVLCLFGAFEKDTNLYAYISATQKTEYTDGELQRMEEAILQLKTEAWDKMTSQERLDVLQVVANIEQTTLGMSKTLKVVAKDMRESMWGYYQEYEWTIYVNRSYLEDKSAPEMLDTICHEAYHAYQWSLAEAYCKADKETRNLQLFREIEPYVEEFLSYKDGLEDPGEYYNQKVEADARTYAAKRVIGYLLLLEDLEEGEEE